MFIRQCYRTKNGRRHAYWALVESYRTASGPRQRVVAWLGRLDEAGRLGVQQAADAAVHSDDSGSPTVDGRWQPLDRQKRFEFDHHSPAVQPRWVEVHAAAVRVENLRQFGGLWIALQLIRTLLQRQKENKKRMKQFGEVEIPQKAFLSVLESTRED